MTLRIQTVNICMEIVSLWLLIVYMDTFLVGMVVAILLEKPLILSISKSNLCKSITRSTRDVLPRWCFGSFFWTVGLSPIPERGKYYIYITASLLSTWCGRVVLIIMQVKLHCTTSNNSRMTTIRNEIVGTDCAWNLVAIIRQFLNSFGRFWSLCSYNEWFARWRPWLSSETTGCRWRGCNTLCPGTECLSGDERGCCGRDRSWYKGFVRGLRCLPSIVQVPNTLRDLVLSLPGLVRGSCHFRGYLAYINQRLKWCLVI